MLTFRPFLTRMLKMVYDDLNAKFPIYIVKYFLTSV